MAPFMSALPLLSTIQAKADKLSTRGGEGPAAWLADLQGTCKSSFPWAPEQFCGQTKGWSVTLWLRNNILAYITSSGGTAGASLFHY